LRLSISAAVVVMAAVLPTAACSSGPTTQSTTSSVAGTTSGAAVAPSLSTVTAAPNPADPVCPLTVDAVKAAIGTVFRGPVKLDNMPGAVECSYQVDDDRWLHIRVNPYAANRTRTITINSTTVHYGGTSAQQVFTSAAAAFQAVAQSSGGGRGFEQYPDVGAGLVTDGMGSFVLAGARDAWYSGDFGIFTSRDYNVVAVNVGKALAAL
jgi:hypothetical protein